MDAAGITDMGGFQTSHECAYFQIAGNGDPYFTLSDELEVTMQVDTAGREIEVILDAEKYPAEIATRRTVPFRWHLPPFMPGR